MVDLFFLIVFEKILSSPSVGYRRLTLQGHDFHGSEHTLRFDLSLNRRHRDVLNQGFGQI